MIFNDLEYWLLQQIDINFHIGKQHLFLIYSTIKIIIFFLFPSLPIIFISIIFLATGLTFA